MHRDPPARAKERNRHALTPAPPLETGVRWQLPDWLRDELDALPSRIVDDDTRMRFVLTLARRNFEGRRTGGPFAAAVVERDTGRLISVGTNQVLAAGASSAHAEILALSLAQSALATWDLAAGHLPALQLVVSWRPCAMCLGAVVWSGVRSLLFAGEGEEVHRITGFDEGPVSPNWRRELGERGIDVGDGLLRAEACQVLTDYARSGASAYNPTRVS